MDHFKQKSRDGVLDGSLSKTFRVRTYTNGKKGLVQDFGA